MNADFRACEARVGRLETAKYELLMFGWLQGVGLLRSGLCAILSNPTEFGIYSLGSQPPQNISAPQL